MVQAIMTLGAIAAAVVGVTGFMTMKSDIQAIIGLVGTFSCLILIGISTILGRLR